MDSKNVNHQISKMGEIEQFSRDELDKFKIVRETQLGAKTLNIFRALRTELLKKSKKKNFVCMISSTCHKGGSSFVAMNLASVFALDKTKTSIMIDANLYSPSLDQLVIGGATSGITDYLSSSELSIKDIVYATGVPRLRVIPIGENKESAAEYFSSDKMRKFIDEVKERYADRYIFIDAPPVTESSEARILTEVADAVVLVVPYGKSTIDQVSLAVDVVGKEKLAGLVYNN